MKIGDIEIENSILSVEHDIIVIQMVLDYIMKNNPALARPTQQDIEEFKNIAITKLQMKYPNMGIRKKP